MNQKYIHSIIVYNSYFFFFSFEDLSEDSASLCFFRYSVFRMVPTNKEELAALKTLAENEEYGVS